MVSHIIRHCTRYRTFSPMYIHVSLLFVWWVLFYVILYEYLYVIMKYKWKIVTRYFICSFRQVINHIFIFIHFFLLCVVFPQQHNIFVHCIVYWKTRKLSVVWKNKQTKKYTQSLWDPRFPLTSTTTTKNNKNYFVFEAKNIYRIFDLLFSI